MIKKIKIDTLFKFLKKYFSGFSLKLKTYKSESFRVTNYSVKLPYKYWAKIKYLGSVNVSKVC